MSLKCSCIVYKDGCKSSNQELVDRCAWKCDMLGMWLYNKLPDGMREAVVSDFFIDGLLIVGVKYLVHGFVSGLYEQYITHEGTNVQDLNLFLGYQRIFVKDI